RHAGRHRHRHRPSRGGDRAGRQARLAVRCGRGLLGHRLRPGGGGHQPPHHFQSHQGEGRGPGSPGACSLSAGRHQHRGSELREARPRGQRHLPRHAARGPAAARRLAPARWSDRRRSDHGTDHDTLAAGGTGGRVPHPAGTSHARDPDRADGTPHGCDPLSDHFDYIIVGGGTAGCVLANRLTACGRYRVLLLEAGGEPSGFWIPIPAGFSKLLVNERWNWRFWSEPEEATNNRKIAIPRGRGLGGSSLINGMIYVRGQKQDYDGWAQAGCTGWSFEDVLPYFKKLEDFDGPPHPLRARGGPLPLTVMRERPALAEAFIAAAEAAGYPRNPDYNADSQDGFGYYQVNQ